MDENKKPRGGPNTPEGKWVSSQNSTDHGMCQQRFRLLPGESAEEFAALHETWRKEYDLDRPAVNSLVETLVERDWAQQRCMHAVCRLEARLAEAEETRPEDVKAIEHLEKRLQNAYRYKTAAENSFARAIRILEKFRKARYDEDFKDGLYAVKRLEVIERAITRRHQLGMDLDLHLEDYNDDNDESTTVEPRRKKNKTPRKPQAPENS